MSIYSNIFRNRNKKFIKNDFQSISRCRSLQLAVLHCCNYRLQDLGSAGVVDLDGGASGSCSSAAIGACERP